MLHEKSCIIINMPKIMIIKYQQFAKTNTFSLSFHILFPISAHFSPFFPKTHRNHDLGMGKIGVGPPQCCGLQLMRHMVAVKITVRKYILRAQ